MIQDWEEKSIILNIIVKSLYGFSILIMIVRNYNILEKQNYQNKIGLGKIVHRVGEMVIQAGCMWNTSYTSENKNC